MRMRLLLVSVLVTIGFSAFAQVYMATVDTAAVVNDSVIAPQSVSTPAVVAPVEKATPAPTTLEETKPAKERADMSSTFDGGLYLRVGLVLPSSDYMTCNAKDQGYSFQMGSQFYIGTTIANFMRFGLDVTWYDFSYVELEMANGTNGYSGLASAFGVGPMVSFAPVKHFVINSYVKALPTFAFSGGEEDIIYTYQDGSLPSYTESGFVGRGGFCIAGVWGLELRYRMVDLGFETVWGKSDVAEVGSSVTEVVAGELGAPVVGAINKIDPFKINNSRVYIGIKF